MYDRSSQAVWTMKGPQASSGGSHAGQQVKLRAQKAITCPPGPKDQGACCSMSNGRHETRLSKVILGATKPRTAHQVRVVGAITYNGFMPPSWMPTRGGNDGVAGVLQCSVPEQGHRDPAIQARSAPHHAGYPFGSNSDQRHRQSQLRPARAFQCLPPQRPLRSTLFQKETHQAHKRQEKTTIGQMSQYARRLV